MTQNFTKIKDKAVIDGQILCVLILQTGHDMRWIRVFTMFEMEYYLLDTSSIINRMCHMCFYCLSISNLLFFISFAVKIKQTIQMNFSVNFNTIHSQLLCQ